MEKRRPPGRSYSNRYSILSKRAVVNMKTMTCKQMGGPCGAAFRGDKADEVIKAQDSHLKDMVAGGDETHESALKNMQDRWKHPVAGMGWYRNTKKAFAALPED
jgi:predicted small metal-binding protein